MARRNRHQEVIRGTATHRRTENDYMAAVLEAVPLDAWREVVTATVEAAKAGDASARAWLGQYLIGRPEGKAPTPLTVVVEQFRGSDPVVDRLAAPIISQARYGSFGDDDDIADRIKASVAAELAKKLPLNETAERLTERGDSGDSAP